MPWDGTMMGWMMFFSTIFWVGLMVVLIFGLIWMSRGFGAVGRTGLKGRAADDEALRILRERYARGEVDRKEFEEKKKDLTA